MMAALAKDAGPEVHELCLVEAAVLVLVEDLDEWQRPLVVISHRLTDHTDHLVWTQHAVVVAIQLAETLRYLLVPVQQNYDYHHQNIIDLIIAVCNGCEQVRAVSLRRLSFLFRVGLCLIQLRFNQTRLQDKQVGSSYRTLITHEPWNACSADIAIIHLYTCDLDLWPLQLEIFSSIPTDIMNILPSFIKVPLPSTDISRHATYVNGRTTREHDASRRLLLAAEA